VSPPGPNWPGLSPGLYPRISPRLLIRSPAQCLYRERQKPNQDTAYVVIGNSLPTGASPGEQMQTLFACAIEAAVLAPQVWRLASTSVGVGVESLRVCTTPQRADLRITADGFSLTMSDSRLELDPRRPP
jgi:hypothetical protein